MITNSMVSCAPSFKVFSLPVFFPLLFNCLETSHACILTPPYRYFNIFLQSSIIGVDNKLMQMSRLPMFSLFIVLNRMVVTSNAVSYHIIGIANLTIFNFVPG